MNILLKSSWIVAATSIVTVLTGCGGGGGGDLASESSGNQAVSNMGIIRPADSNSPGSASFGDVAPSGSGTGTASGSTRMANLTQFVNPFIGTQNTSNPPTDPVPAGMRGGTFPGATAPFGMIQWTPMTPSNGAWGQRDTPIGYVYTEDTIIGFPMTQMSGAGCGGNSGEIPVMPTYSEGGGTQTSSKFLHSNEAATPGYYRVKLGTGIKVELTTTTRTGFGRFTYPIGDKVAALNINTINTNTGQREGAITSVDTVNKIIKGYAPGGGFCQGGTDYRVYYTMKFQTRNGIDISVIDGPGWGDKLVQFISRDGIKSPGEVLMKVGLSYVSGDKATANLDAENPKWDFDSVRVSASDTWNKYLNAIQVSSGTGLTDPKHQAEYVRFYTALYHSMLSPNTNSDVDGQYLNFNGGISKGTKTGGVHYANYSNWDIYRSLIPLVAMLYPTQASDMVQSTIDDADQCGALPRWSAINVDKGVMPGDSGVNVVAGAYAFGARKFDTAKALQFIKASGNSPGVTCNGSSIRENAEALRAYLNSGYVPSNQGGVWGPGSLTYEFVANDSAAAAFAQSLGDDTSYRIFTGRAANWKNIFDTKSNMLLPRYGDFLEFDHYAEMVEGNPAQYNWMNTFNSKPMFSMIKANSNGASGVVTQQLDSYFSKLNVGINLPNFYIGNEPSFAGPWQYNWSGAPSHTQRTVHAIMYGDSNNAPPYSNGPGGLPGNDDLGATSSWYVWAAIGLYPSIPHKGGLAIHGPSFDSVVIHWADGANHLTMNAKGTSWGSRKPSEYYVYSAVLDDMPVYTPWVWLNSDIQSNSTLNFLMSASPQEWGADEASSMPSFGIEELGLTGDYSDNPGFRKDGVGLNLTISKCCVGANSYLMEGLSFDGSGNSFSTDALGSVWGVYPGDTIDMYGIRFTWPSGVLDNFITKGQVLFPTDVQNAYSNFALLASANNGPSKGKMSIVYTDGTSETADLTVGDWVGSCGDAKQSTLINGTTRWVTSQVGLTMPYRLDASGNKVSNDTAPAACIYLVRVGLDRAKKVKNVVLPYQVDHGQQHIFAYRFQ